MEQQGIKSVREKYDDITANLYAGNEYVAELPSFEEFTEFYEILVQEFFHNAKIGNWRLADGARASANRTTEELHDEWSKRIFSWMDVEEYVSDWIVDKL